MESRMNNIYGVRNDVLTECEKMLQYVNIIKNKTDNVVNYIKQLNTQSFLKQYAPMYKYLHELNEKLVEQNCQFELFFLESKDFPSINSNALQLHPSLIASDNIYQPLVNNNTLEITVKTELCPNIKEEIPDTLFITSTNSTDANVNIKNVDQNRTINVDCNVENCAPLDEQVCNNSAENLTCVPDDTKTEEGMLNIQNLIEKLNKRTQEREQESSAQIPDLRPVVVANDYYESTSTSEYSTSDLSSSKQNQKKKSYLHVHKNRGKPETNKTIQNIVNNIEIKQSPVPKEGDLCYVSHIESPSNFYIQVVSEDNSLIDYLSHQIQEVLSCLKSFQTKTVAKKAIRDYCVCYIGKTNSWYRAKILSWLMENEELISVQLVDYGNTCFVPLKNIREAIPYFFALHLMATRCKLAWVKPPNNANEWPNKSIEYFRNILCSNEEILYFISHVHQDRDILSVDLQNSDMASLAGDLIYNQVAMDNNENEDEDEDIWCNDFMKDQVIHSQGFSKNELKMTEEEKLQQDLEFDDDEEHNDPTLAVAHYKPRDETEICRIFLANGYCFKGDNCRFSHTPLNPEGWTTDRDAVYFEAFNKLVLPEKGEITVKIISIVDLRTYYVAIKGLPQCMMSVTQTINNIKSLVSFMNDPAEIQKYKPLKVKPAYGELILVKYNNEQWQRGQILECHEYCNRVELDIFLVDFGVVLERVNMKTVRSIREDHLHLPFQAIMCCLANVKMKSNLTEEENDMGSDYLEINILNKKLKARIIYSSSYLNVNLYNEEGNDVGQELFKAGIVEKCPHLIALNTNSHILID